jgi:hypothetical protein
MEDSMLKQKLFVALIFSAFAASVSAQATVAHPPANPPAASAAHPPAASAASIAAAHAASNAANAAIAAVDGPPPKQLGKSGKSSRRH